MDSLIAKLHKSQDGITLVELMIVVVLLSIVLTVGYMYFDYGVQAFERGERQAIAQKAARLTSDFITTELRFAKEIEINPDGVYADNGDFEVGYKYIYLDENDSVVFRDLDGSRKILADSQADDMAFNIFFSSNVPHDVVYFYMTADLPPDTELVDYVDDETYQLDLEKLKAEKGTGLYLLSTKVQALNLELYRTYGIDSELIKLNGLGGTVIKYRYPAND